MAQMLDWLDEDTLIRRAGTKGVPGAGGGRAAILEMPPEFLATTVQACGMYPWAIGGSTPMIGVPMGTNLLNSSTVCFDPIAWFTARPRLCDNPSIFVLGLPHKGKSTMVAHMLIGMSARGIRPLILGDLKPDYIEVVRKLGGQVIRLGRGEGRWNPLTPGNIFAAADHIEAAGTASGGAAAERARTLPGWSVRPDGDHARAAGDLVRLARRCARRRRRQRPSRALHADGSR